MKPLDPRPLTGRKVFGLLLAFFGIVIGANLVLMKFAIETMSGTEVDSAYRASLAYGQEIVAARDQNTRNWKVNARVRRIADGGAALQIEANDGNGRPMSGVDFLGRFERPIDKRADRPVVLAEVERGVYRGAAAGVASGQWDLVIEGDVAGQRLFLSKNRVLLD